MPKRMKTKTKAPGRHGGGNMLDMDELNEILETLMATPFASGPVVHAEKPRWDWAAKVSPDLFEKSPAPLPRVTSRSPDRITAPRPTRRPTTSRSPPPRRTVTAAAAAAAADQGRKRVTVKPPVPKKATPWRQCNRDAAMVVGRRYGALTMGTGASQALAIGALRRVFFPHTASREIKVFIHSLLDKEWKMAFEHYEAIFADQIELLEPNADFSIRVPYLRERILSDLSQGIAAENIVVIMGYIRGFHNHEGRGNGVAELQREFNFLLVEDILDGLPACFGDGRCGNTGHITLVKVPGNVSGDECDCSVLLTNEPDVYAFVNFALDQVTATNRWYEVDPDAPDRTVCLRYENTAATHSQAIPDRRSLEAMLPKMGKMKQSIEKDYNKYKEVVQKVASKLMAVGIDYFPRFLGTANIFPTLSTAADGCNKGGFDKLQLRLDSPVVHNAAVRDAINRLMMEHGFAFYEMSILGSEWPAFDCVFEIGLRGHSAEDWENLLLMVTAVLAMVGRERDC